MKAVELSGFVDGKGFLKLDYPLLIANQRVKVLILIPEEEEISDQAWLQAISSNPVWNFLHEDAENIYGVEDGKPITYEK